MMSYRNTATTYGSVAKFLHWTIALLIVVMVIVGYTYELFPENIEHNMMWMHKSTGLLILGLMMLRIVWALGNPKPLLPPHTKPWERVAEKFVHGGLYALLIVMPISGWIMATAADKSPSFYGLCTIALPGVPIDKALAKSAQGWHGFIAFVIIAFVTIHIFAALKHHFVDKDDVLKRMMPRR